MIEKTFAHATSDEQDQLWVSNPNIGNRATLIADFNRH
jgi:hypothetical protein